MMAAGINIGDMTASVDQRSFARALLLLRTVSNGVNRAGAKAVNIVIKRSKRSLAREVARVFNIKVGRVDREIKMQPATAGQENPTGKLYVKSPAASRIPLSEFGATETARGVAYRIERGGGKRSQLPGFFIAIMASGHRGVFKRIREAAGPIGTRGGEMAGRYAHRAPGGKGTALVQGARLLGQLRGTNAGIRHGLPIAEKFGLSVAAMMTDKPAILENVQKVTGDDLTNEFDKQVDRLLQGRLVGAVA